jgi:hypothetical protein
VATVPPSLRVAPVIIPSTPRRPRALAPMRRNHGPSGVAKGGTKGPDQAARNLSSRAAWKRMDKSSQDREGVAEQEHLQD